MYLNFSRIILHEMKIRDSEHIPDIINNIYNIMCFIFIKHISDRVYFQLTIIAWEI